MGSTAISEAIPEKNTGRQSWPKYFMSIADVVATRGTCDRLKVGAVFVKDNRILATGYNGALPGRKHCDEVGHLIHEGHCVRTVHAEENAIAQAARHGVSLLGSTLFVTHLPCIKCYGTVIAAGCVHIYYKEQYGSADMKLYYELQGMSRLEKLNV